ncbi:precorrin-8X methylmutase [Eubacteriales bacterium OttesenSCG-928-N13]|nr:precorrin-8X methylmutase [Eubacteriales bacterium OttesenSCG-928-N13]
MRKKGQQDAQQRKMAMPYVTSEMASIMRYVEREVKDPTLAQSLHFSPTALALVRRVMMSGGRVITDTTLAQHDVSAAMSRTLGIEVQCFIDDPQVVNLAMHKRITRAEIALDHALMQSGMKLLVVGSAPMAIDRLLKRKQAGPINDVVVLATPSGFASVVQLKERLWESDIPCIVARGRKGGTAAAVALVNALMAESIKEQGL